MPTWREEQKVCSGGFNKLYGNNITYQKCDDWENHDVNDCDRNKPSETKYWQACGIGSSPGGGEPGHRLSVCSGPTEEFSCKWGQNCYAITKTKPSPLCAVKEILISCFSCLCCIIIMILIAKRRRRFVIMR